MQFERKVSLNTLAINMGKVLGGSHGGESKPADDIPRYLRMMKGGCFDPKGFVSHRVSLSEVNEGIAKMKSGEVIHCMIHFTHK